MQIVYHIGAHCTDEGLILAGLNANRQMLNRAGVAVPQPGRFRPVLREAQAVTRGGRAAPESQEILLGEILPNAKASRVILTNDAFLCSASVILEQGQFYGDAGPKCRRLANLFADQDIEFAIAIRNPATFLPAVFARTGSGDFAAFLAQADILRLRWSSVIARISHELPGVPIHVWCNEETPFLWDDILRRLAGLSRDTEVAGFDEFLAEIMTKEGIDRSRAYQAKHPPTSRAQRNRILAAFLDKFQIEDATQNVTARGWGDETIARLTDIYEEDLFVIDRLPGIDFLSP